MYAIASLLDLRSEQIVKELWERFEENCGLVGVKVAPLPHFSWQGADSYQMEPVEETLAEISAQLMPFHVRTAGLGIFTGPLPVVYIPLVKDEQLLNIHKMLWERLRPYAVVPNPYYDPSHWMPHITLAIRELEPERLACAVADIARLRIEFDIVVDHTAIIYQTGGKAGMKSTFKFGDIYQPPGGL
jgi:2'-5' RNA ligase